MPTRVLVDTSAFYALVVNGDQFHQSARQKFAELVADEAEMYASSYILVETAALVTRRFGHEAITTFIDAIRDRLFVIWVTRDTHWQAWDMLKHRSRQGLSLVDCTTVIFAKNLDAQVFTFDSDFSREGIVTVPR